MRCPSCGEDDMAATRSLGCTHEVCSNCDHGLCGGPCTTGEPNAASVAAIIDGVVETWPDGTLDRETVNRAAAAILDVLAAGREPRDADEFLAAVSFGDRAAVGNLLAPRS